MPARALGPPLERARIRVSTSLTAVLLACTAAAVAWWFAHDVLGHQRPFFAPVAAAISLTTSRLEPSARIAQMVGGVLVGILTAEALHGLLGSGPVAPGVIALFTMLLARALAGGFLGESVFFVNQAVAAAILVWRWTGPAPLRNASSMHSSEARWRISSALCSCPYRRSPSSATLSAH